jgi:hypothetical protein
MNHMDQRTDKELLAGLRTLIDQGEVRLELDAARLDHMDSPVSVQSESTRWFAALFAACGAAFWFGGWIGGAASVVASIVLWFAWVRPRNHRRIRARVHDAALKDIQTWRALWRFGGVGLVADGATCSAPSDNWMQLVRDRKPSAAQPIDSSDSTGRP